MIRCVRDRFLERGFVRRSRKLSSALKARFRQQGGKQCLYRLFHFGRVLNACRLAGVPLPFFFVVAGALLIGITAADWPGFVVLCSLAFVMGLKGGAISTFSGIRLPTVVVTSTLVNLIDGLVRRGYDRVTVRPAPPSHLGHLTAAWIAYGIGGGVAVLAQSHLAVPLVVPALLYAAVAVKLLR